MARMISKLSTSDFVKRLEENTKIGDPGLKGTPLVVFTMFGGYKMKFYGEYSSSDFRLTANAIIIPTPYIFEGTIKSQDDGSSEISLKIKPIWFGYLWIRVAPIFALIFINIILISNIEHFEVGEYIAINTIPILMFTPILLTIRKKNKLLRDFKELMEIA